MLYQNILISPDIFDYISRYYAGDKNCEDFNLKSYKENLALKCLILGKRNNKFDLLEEIKEIVAKSSGFGKEQLEIIINEFLKSNRCKFVETTVTDQFVSNEKHNYLFNLCKDSSTKIINSQLDLLQYKESINDFEILSIDDFNNPPSSSFIYNRKRDISLKKGDIFNIYQALNYYWKNTKSLIIEDDYLRKKDNHYGKGQFSKLIELLKTCNNLSALTIRTVFNYGNEKPDEYYNRKHFEDEIKREIGVTPKIEEQKVGERHYYTDNFDIHLGKGLDFFNDKYRVWRPRITIAISQKE